MGAFLAPNFQRPSYWNIFGHSYTAGAVGTAEQTGRFDWLFRNAMGCTPNDSRNHSVSGALLTMELRRQGGWCRIFYECNPKRGSFPWSANDGAKLLCYGINDLGIMGTPDMAQMTAAYGLAMEACVSRCRASAVFGSTSTAFTAYGAGFTSGASAEFTDGFVRQATALTNANITITIPPNYTGEPIAICFLGHSGTGNGGIITFSGSAGITGTMNTNNIMPAATASRCPMIKRITNLTAANIGQTIICTLTTVTAGVTWFDSWWIEATDPPVVLVCDINKLTAAGYTGGFPANWTGTEAQKDADVEKANQLIANVLTAFNDGMVQEVSLDSVVRKDPLLTWDGIHLNEEGSLLAVDACLTAYDKLTPPRSGLNSYASFNPPASRWGSVVRTRMSGHWYTSDCNGIGGTPWSLVSGTMFAQPFQITGSRDRYIQLGAECSTLGTTGSSILLGIYNDTNGRGYPQFLELTSNSITVLATTGAKQSTAIQWIPDPGQYWLVFKATTVVATAAIMRAITGPSIGMPTLQTTGIALSATTNPVAWQLTGQGTGALPLVFPSGGTLVDSAPFVGIKLQ